MNNKWEGKKYNANGAILTSEFIDEFMKKCTNIGKQHPCINGHFVNGEEYFYKKKKTIMCLNCGQKLKK